LKKNIAKYGVNLIRKKGKKISNQRVFLESGTVERKIFGLEYTG